MTVELRALSGMRDYVGSAGEELVNLAQRARECFAAAGYREIQTPVMEDARLFDRSLGPETDVVSKEMYTIEQSEDRVLCLRPENTAGVVRAVVEGELMANRNQLKLMYAGPMFRHERPQSGRLRQFHQVGVELFGREEPLADAEVLTLAQEYLSGQELGEYELLLNSIGCPRCRPGYLEELLSALEEFRGQLCEDCQRRWDANPMRLLDCKEPACQAIYEEHAPSILDYLCEACDEHFDAVRDYLNLLEIPFSLEPRLVRGLDYYRRTTFEFVSPRLGSQDTILAGGRYDGLMEELGGDPCPAIGFAAGLERMMILSNHFESFEVETRADCYVVTFDEPSLRAALPLVRRLRRETLPTDTRRFRVELGHPGDSLRSQLRRANRYKARVVFLLGSDELSNDELTVKRMDTGEQYQVAYPPFDSVAQALKDEWTNVNPDEIRI